MVVLTATILVWVPVFGAALSIPGGSSRLLANISAWMLIYAGQYFLPIAILRCKLWNEGVTNVIRHAKARECRMRFALAEAEQQPQLVVTVADDGRSLPLIV